VNKLTLAVAAQRVNGGIDSISYDSVAAFHAGVASISHKTSATVRDIKYRLRN
jgi:hypothetical protein